MPLPTKPAPATVAERCYTESPGAIIGIKAADGASTLSAVTYGSGSTAAIFLHQTGAGGLCGWVPFGTWVAGQGVRAILVDDCSHGRSQCSPQVLGDARATVAIAVDWARSGGATRVVLVGASMGGAVALGTAQDVGADAVVDLSGPSRWQGVPDAVTAARAISIPLLLVVAADDSTMGIPDLQQAAEESPATTKDFVTVDTGHGWDLTSTGSPPNVRPTDVGRRVLGWI
ncbi:MAG: dienelactone hydrolase family protein [Ornithinibacter sp.]